MSLPRHAHSTDRQWIVAPVTFDYIARPVPYCHFHDYVIPIRRH